MFTSFNFSPTNCNVFLFSNIQVRNRWKSTLPPYNVPRINASSILFWWRFLSLRYVCVLSNTTRLDWIHFSFRPLRNPQQSILYANSVPIYITGHPTYRGSFPYTRETRLILVFLRFLIDLLPIFSSLYLFQIVLF